MASQFLLFFLYTPVICPPATYTFILTIHHPSPSLHKDNGHMTSPFGFTCFLSIFGFCLSSRTRDHTPYNTREEMKGKTPSVLHLISRHFFFTTRHRSPDLIRFFHSPISSAYTLSSQHSWIPYVLLLLLPPHNPILHPILILTRRSSSHS